MASYPNRPGSREEAEADHELTRLFIANQLGPRPHSEEAEETAIRRASAALDMSPLEEAARARRILAIEDTAWHMAGEHMSEDAEADDLLPHPTEDEWVAAIVAVDAMNDAEVRRRARGGMVIRAAQDGWLDR